MKIINMRKCPHIPENAVRIDRRTRWGNPYRIGRDGTREEVIERYRETLWRRIRNGEIDMKELAALDGKTLACWCTPQRCHGEILSRAAIWAARQLDDNPRTTLQAEEKR